MLKGKEITVVSSLSGVTRERLVQLSAGLSDGTPFASFSFYHAYQIVIVADPMWVETPQQFCCGVFYGWDEITEIIVISPKLGMAL